VNTFAAALAGTVVVGINPRAVPPGRLPIKLGKFRALLTNPVFNLGWYVG
jgi:hypothetical protein